MYVHTKKYSTITDYLHIRQSVNGYGAPTADFQRAAETLILILIANF